MTPNPFVGPVVALVLWTFVMFAWMYATRLPAVRRARMRLDPQAPRGAQMQELPPNVRWKADNYNHLMEMPTLFYAVCLGHAVVGSTTSSAVTLAWAYVGLRVVHSVFQAAINKIEVRFVLFFLSSLTLLALSVQLAQAAF